MNMELRPARHVDYHRKLARVLKGMGGLYTFRDLLDQVTNGNFRSWVEGNSWAITQDMTFPNKKVLDIIVAVGDLKDCRILHDRILEYAKDEGIELIRAFGRRGWLDEAKSNGWRRVTTNQVYVRDI